MTRDELHRENQELRQALSSIVGLIEDVLGDEDEIETDDLDE